MDSCAGAILAGGKSSRMGKDKASLRLGEKTFLQQMTDILLAGGVDKIYINRPDILADDIPGHGPLSGVHAVLRHAMGHHTHLVFVPVDMPCLTPEVIGRLIRAPLDKALVRYAPYVLPFRLALEPPWLWHAERLLRDGKDVSLRHFQAQVENALVFDDAPADPRIFRNINTPEEWHSVAQQEAP